MTTPDVPQDTHDLPAGGRMPLLGFGTWRLTGAEAERATAEALAAGYRHVDTATMYGNEAEVGRALRDHPAVFVTTKLPPDRAARPRETLEQSLEQLGRDVLDLWLVHWPLGAPQDDPRLLEEHRRRGIVVEGYSGLKGGLLEDPVVTRVGERLGCAPAQVLVRWHLEHGIVVIPKSSRRERIRSNADVGGFRLQPDEVAALDGLAR